MCLPVAALLIELLRQYMPELQSSSHIVVTFNTSKFPVA